MMAKVQSLVGRKGDEAENPEQESGPPVQGGIAEKNAVGRFMNEEEAGIHGQGSDRQGRQIQAPGDGGRPLAKAEEGEPEPGGQQGGKKSVAQVRGGFGMMEATDGIFDAKGEPFADSMGGRRRQRLIDGGDPIQAGVGLNFSRRTCFQGPGVSSTFHLISPNLAERLL